MGFLAANAVAAAVIHDLTGHHRSLLTGFDARWSQFVNFIMSSSATSPDETFYTLQVKNIYNVTQKYEHLQTFTSNLNEFYNLEPPSSWVLLLLFCYTKRRSDLQDCWMCHIKWSCDLKNPSRLALSDALVVTPQSLRPISILCACFRCDIQREECLFFWKQQWLLLKRLA